MAKKDKVTVGSLLSEEKPKTTSNKFDAARSTIANINKAYGGSAIKIGSDIPEIHKVPTYEPWFDYVLDGGIPISRVIELLGQEHSGKTRISIVAMGEFQKYCMSCKTPRALTAVWSSSSGTPELIECSCSNCDNPRTSIQAFVDYEGTTDPDFLKLLGVDIHGIIYSRPKYPSMATDLVDTLLKNPEIGLIVFDSVGSLGSDKEVNTSMEENKMNQNALFLNAAVRKWQASLNVNTNTDKDSSTTLIVINQSYSSIGHISYEVAQGGRGLRHGKGISVKSRIIEKTYTDTTKSELRGVHVGIVNEKNKTGRPYRRASFFVCLTDTDKNLSYCGIDKASQLVELGLHYDMIEQRGAWIYYENDKFQGRQAFIDHIRTDEEFFKQLQENVYSKFKLTQP